MKKIIYFLFLLITTCSYSNKNKILYSTKDSLQIAKKTIKTYKKGILESEDLVVYTYENGLVTKIITTRKDGTIQENANMKYENGILKQMDVAYNPIKQQNTITKNQSTITAVYNYTDALITSLNNVENEKLHFTTYFSYDKSGQLIKKQITKDGVLQDESKFVYDKKGNIFKVLDSDSSTSELYTKYDDKKNPFSLIFPSSYLKIYKIPKNNIKSCKKNDQNYSYAYEYNSSHYPTKIIEKVGNEIQNITLIEYPTINID